MVMAGTEDTELDMVMRGPIMSLTVRFASNVIIIMMVIIIIMIIMIINDIIIIMINHQITYDVVTEEQCATHSVPECATVVRQVPEQVRIVIIAIIVIIIMTIFMIIVIVIIIMITKCQVRIVIILLSFLGYS